MQNLLSKWLFVLWRKKISTRTTLHSFTVKVHTIYSKERKELTKNIQQTSKLHEFRLDQLKNFCKMNVKKLSFLQSCCKMKISISK